MLTLSFLFRPIGLLLTASILISFQLYASEEYFPKQQLLHTASRGNRAGVQYWLNAGADVNKTTNYGQTPLLWACQKEDEPMVVLLVQAEADVNKADNFGQTPLFWACQRGNQHIVALLVQAKAEVNKATNFGRTPLYNACSEGHKNIAALLIGAGADINKATNFGRTPLYMACLEGHKDIAVFLCQHGAHFLHESIIHKLPSENSKALAEACNCIINERTALLKQLLDGPRENNFLQKVQLPKVLQALIIRDMLGHKNCDLQ